MKSVGAVLFVLFASVLLAQDKKKPAAPKLNEGEKVLHAMGKVLGSAKSFRFKTRIEFDLVIGAKLRFSAKQSVSVKRPDRLRVEYRGDIDQRNLWFDGKRFVYYDRAEKFYAKMDAGPTIDDALNKVFARGGFSVPAADFVVADPYQSLVGSAQEVRYLGRQTVDGIPCHHVLIREEAVDGQVWIDAGAQPLPRKIVLTYKKVAQSPQFEATFTHWEVNGRVREAEFGFVPPPAAVEIEMVASKAGVEK